MEILFNFILIYASGHNAYLIIVHQHSATTFFDTIFIYRIYKMNKKKSIISFISMTLKKLVRNVDLKKNFMFTFSQRIKCSQN